MKRTQAWRNLSFAVVLGTCCALPAIGLSAEKFVPPARPIPLAPGYNPPTPPPAPAPAPAAQTPAPAPAPAPVTPRPVQFPPSARLQPLQNPVVPPQNNAAAVTKAQPATYLAWDAESKETNTVSGVSNVHFTFWLTNVSSEVVAINSLRTSCGCTVAQLPSQPWKIPPGSNGPIEVTMNLVGKSGTIVKSVTVDSTAGIKNLLVRANIAPPTNHNNIPVASSAAPNMGDVERIKNMQAALADRQVVFKNKDCAKCHADPAFDKNGLAVLGENLYKGVCANCHDSPHRASMVPDLHALKHPTSPEHWKRWIRSGRVGSMMPAFAKAEGGILTDEQIDSLVEYLSKTIPSTPRQPAAPATAKPLDVQKPKQSASLN